MNVALMSLCRYLQQSVYSIYGKPEALLRRVGLSSVPDYSHYGRYLLFSTCRHPDLYGP